MSTDEAPLNSLAIVGARSLQAEALLNLLADRGVGANLLRLLDDSSAAADGESLSYGERELEIGDAQQFDFSTMRQSVLFGRFELALVRQILDAGCRLIDATGAYAASDDVPLLAPEAGAALSAEVADAALLALPCGLSVALIRTLRPIANAAGIKRVRLSTYQSASIVGREATAELGRQTVDLLNFREPEQHAYPRRIAFNVIPQLGDWRPDGSSAGEQRLADELSRLLGADRPIVHATAVQVPMFYGCAAAVQIETAENLSLDQARALLAAAADLHFAESAQDFPTPAEVLEQEGLCVGRLRVDPTHPNGLSLWLAADELRLGADNALRVLDALEAA